ncbi:LrgB family protein [Halioxenophilus sp. WMMB6]|uniref:LrgB family protein n=1 Tax=Halioxenophilus sp. WMMB6 TaxID=3073815 RepID=UPI00295F06D7|nr:LrgB family protein [Halioxenophilus sp. WMMB6]
MSDSALNQVASLPLTSMLLTLAAFQIGLLAYRASGNKVWLHPVLVGSLIIAGAISLMPINYADYLRNNSVVMFFLGPLIVALAVPLKAELAALRGLVLPAMVVIVFGAIVAPAVALGCAWLAGADQQVLVSLMPKSVTSPIAIGVAQSIGGLVVLATAVTVFTGIIGGLMAPTIFRLVGLTDDRLQGLVLGINCHGLGTARGFEISVRCGALAGLGMGLTGCLSAFLLPYAHTWLFG